MLTAAELMQQVGGRLRLTWRNDGLGGARALDNDEHAQRRPSLVGYLNIIYPNRVQIVGAEELRYLDGLEPGPRADTIAKIVAYGPVALIVTRDQAVPADLEAAADAAGIALWVTPLRGHEVVTYLHYHLTRALARRTTLHGTLMEVFSIGVLITGEAGAGKSELALELISRGHRLVADDAPEFSQIAPDVIDGTCPEMLRDLLEVRGLGVINVREMFGHTAVKHNKYLRLIVHLADAAALGGADGMQRLTGISGTRPVLDVAIPQITIPVAPGRNLAVLVETAVRQHLLRAKGIDAAQTFIDRQAHHLKRQTV